MNIAIIGYGQMGKEIEKISVSRGHKIGKIIDVKTENKDLNDCDAAIIFTTPQSAVENIKLCIDNKIPVVCGTTGWLDEYNYIINYCTEKDGTFLFSPNFSIGVNIFFKINEVLSKLIKPYSQYIPSIEEIHHIEKLDSPSGTAIKLAQDILKNSCFSEWTISKNNNKNELKINHSSILNLE